jgi:hypothetical protein
MFGLLVFGFHIIEEVVRRLLHGEAVVGALHNIHINDLIGRVSGDVVYLHSFLRL